MNGYRHNKPSRPAPPADGSQPSALNSQPSTLNPRSGFTLIELMVVVVIIAVLVGLLLPAIFGAMSTARVAEVRTEISQLDSAIAAFKAEYGGIAPPSQITLCVSEAQWNSNPRSKAIIRRIWPQFNFSGNGGGGWTTAKTLNGAECLVFFLGGVIHPTQGDLVGFSKNPALPFDPNGNRVGPFFEFDGGADVTDPANPIWKGRLVDNNGNKAPEYVDPLPSQTSPYIYYSSYDGRGYRTTGTGNELIGGMADVYRQSSGGAAYKPNSHQIISPGADTLYGVGGVYDGEDFIVLSEAERDNITNFSSGQLVP